jgi:hypothetical protein
LTENAPPPAERGNLRALTHGANADRFVMPEADQLVTFLYSEYAHLTAADRLAVRDYAIAQTRAWRLGAWIEANGELDARSRVRPALEHLRKWLERAEKARARLGLDPLARASLAVDQMVATGKLRELRQQDLSEGRRLRLEAEQRAIEGEAEAEDG